MDDAVRHQLDINEQENEIKFESEKLSRLIMRAKDDSNRKLKLFMSMFDKTYNKSNKSILSKVEYDFLLQLINANKLNKTKNNSTLSDDKYNLFMLLYNSNTPYSDINNTNTPDIEANLIFYRSLDILKGINTVINKVYHHYNVIASDVTFENYKSNQELLDEMTIKLFNPSIRISPNRQSITYNSYKTEFEKLIELFYNECVRFNTLENRIKTIHLSLNISPLNKKRGRNLITVSTVRDIRAELTKIQEWVQRYINKKKKSQSLESSILEKGKILGNISHLRKKDLKDIVKMLVRILKVN